MPPQHEVEQRHDVHHHQLHREKHHNHSPMTQQVVQVEEDLCHILFLCVEVVVRHNVAVGNVELELVAEPCDEVVGVGLVEGLHGPVEDPQEDLQDLEGSLGLEDDLQRLEKGLEEGVDCQTVDYVSLLLPDEKDNRRLCTLCKWCL